MEKELQEKVKDPFFTTKRGKRFGLGLSLLEQSAVTAGGRLKVSSVKNKGCEIYATFVNSHIDRIPLGDIGATLLTLIMSHPDIHFNYIHKINEKTFQFDTKKIALQKEGIAVDNPGVIKTLKEVLSHDIHMT
jgi:hypothetical protein